MQHYNSAAHKTHTDNSTLSGTVKSVVLHNEETGFCVLTVELRGGKTATVRGLTPSVAPGEQVMCRGEWVHDINYGHQFRASELHFSTPQSADGIILFLSASVSGFGKARGKRLVEKFEGRLADVIENSPEELDSVKGITQAMREEIVSVWHSRPKQRALLIFMQEAEISQSHAPRILRVYGENAIDAIRTNPYRLSRDIRGIGFKTADKIARTQSFPLDSPLRLREGLKYVMEEFAEDKGHCTATKPMLIESAGKLLGVPSQVLEHELAEAVAAGDLILESFDNKEHYYLPKLHRAEVSVAAHLKRLLAGKPHWPEINIEAAIEWVQKRNGMVLSNSQKNALSVGINSKVMVICGGPGVGKTAILKSLLMILAAKKTSATLCAPTGRAAKRMTESTGLPASTIHRLLEFDPRTRSFTRNADNPIDTDLLVIDEVSMLDIQLFRSLLAALPDKTALLCVGDPDQLQAIYAGNVLQDMLDSPCILRAHLTEVFRQAEASRIVLAAHAINHGKTPAAGENGDFTWIVCEDPREISGILMNQVVHELPERYGYDPVKDIYVLTPMHKGELGTVELNKRLQQLLQVNGGPYLKHADWCYYVGDKVVQMRNNYDKDIMNGDVGFVSGIDPAKRQMHVNFDGRRVSYSSAEFDQLAPNYCSTIHRGQGSEFPCVVIPLSKDHYVLLNKKMLYTAVTRGRKHVVLIGQTSAMYAAIHNDNSVRRLTRLSTRLRQNN